MTELVPVFDRENTQIDIVPRHIMREQNLIHRAAYIFVFTPMASLCVQQRTDTKDVFPGYWDLAAGGVVTAGETEDTTAVRELAEELGIYDQPLHKHEPFFYEDDQCKVWGSVYSLVWEGNIIPQASEIAQTRFLGVEDIPEFLSNEKITPTTYKAYTSLLGVED